MFRCTYFLRTLFECGGDLHASPVTPIYKPGLCDNQQTEALPQPLHIGSARTDHVRTLSIKTTASTQTTQPRQISDNISHVSKWPIRRCIKDIYDRACGIFRLFQHTSGNSRISKGNFSRLWTCLGEC